MLLIQVNLLLLIVDFAALALDMICIHWPSTTFKVFVELAILEMNV
jgi:hypothetical protein